MRVPIFSGLTQSISHAFPTDKTVDGAFLGTDVGVDRGVPSSRGDRIRTYDIQLPKLALYQAELRPVAPTGTEKWLGTESNRRHGDFQSPALPTELPSRRNTPKGKVTAAA